MLKNGIVLLLICFITYEIFEHIILPLFWMIRYRKRKPTCDPSGMVGKKCVVKQWDGATGKVCVGSEIWKAIGPSQLMRGDKAVIQDIKGLTLQISSPAILINSPNNNSAEE